MLPLELCSHLAPLYHSFGPQTDPQNTLKMVFSSPSVSRASSIAPPPSSHRDRSPSASNLYKPSAAPQVDYHPGCSHIAALSPSTLKQTLRRYAIGLRWGKRVRRGIVKSEEDYEQQEHDSYGGYQHDGIQTGKRRKVSGQARAARLCCPGESIDPFSSLSPASSSPRMLELLLCLAEALPLSGLRVLWLLR